MRSLLTLKALTYAPDRRHRRGRHHLAARGDRRRTQLGLPLLLAARRHLHPARPAADRLPRRGRAWREWLLRAIAGAPGRLQILYGVAGERRLPESELPWLPGYEGSRPVRIGNAAVGQLQLDVYGEVMDTLWLARASSLDARRGRLAACSVAC